MSFFTRGDVLVFEVPEEDGEKAEAEEEFSWDMPGISLKARKVYGRYFGICSSYHHLKACVCKTCPSYPGGTGMFCARGNSEEARKKEGCLCETCELFKKFRLEGEYFCQPRERVEVFEGPRISPNICTNFHTSAGTIRVCVLDDRTVNSR